MFLQFYQPVFTLLSLMEYAHSWPDAQNFYPYIAAKLWTQVPDGYLQEFFTAPSAVICPTVAGAVSCTYPPELGAPAPIDLLGYSNLTLRANVLAAIAASVAQPMKSVLLPRDAYGPMRWQLVGTVWVHDVDADEGFGLPLLNATKCPTCYVEATRSKFWGTVGAVVRLDDLANLNNTYLQRLVQGGYVFSITRLSEAGEPSQAPVVLAQTSQAPSAAAASQTSATALGTIVINLELASGTSQTWLAPAIAVEVVFSICAALLLLLLLLSRAQHQLLLKALVPEGVLDRAKATHSFVRGKAEAAIDSGTPASKILALLEGLHSGVEPCARDVVTIRASILQGDNLYEPVNLQERMAAALDDDVASALMRTLGTHPVAREGAHGGAPETGAAIAEVLEQMRNSAGCSIDFEDFRVLATGGVARILEALLTSGLTAAGQQQQQGSRRPSVELALASPFGSVDGPAAAQGRAMAPLLRDDGGLSMGGTASGGKRCFDSAAAVVRSFARQQTVRLSSEPIQPPDVRALSGSPLARTGLLVVLDGGRAPRVPVMSPAQLNGAEGVVEPPRLGAPAYPILEEVERLLASASNTWKFDAFVLDDASRGHGLSMLGFHLMHHSGLIAKFKLRPQALARFLTAIERGYKQNPYHNSMHASDVLQAVHQILCQGGLLTERGYADPLTQLACYVAAIVHDYEHKGWTNDFLINSEDPLALMYNDRSPMENHHVAAAFALLRTAECNFLDGSALSKEQLVALRKLIIDLVLGTDMKSHFSITTHFVTLHRASIDAATERAARAVIETAPLTGLRAELASSGEHAMRQLAHSDSGAVPVAPQVPVPKDEADRLLGLQMMLKCADLSHLFKDMLVHLQWIGRLEEEFFLQGDQEKARKIPVSPLFDRDKPGATKSQVGFYTFVACPLFENFARVFQGAVPAYEQLMENLQYWQDAEQAGSAAASGSAIPRASG